MKSALDGIIEIIGTLIDDAADEIAEAMQNAGADDGESPKVALSIRATVTREGPDDAIDVKLGFVQKSASHRLKTRVPNQPPLPFDGQEVEP